MMKNIAVLSLLLVCASFTACATISKQECQVADWYALGVKDGKVGADVGKISSYYKDCAKVGVTPNEELWKQGRKEGLKSYCTVPRAYNRGLSGSHFYSSLCPVQMHTQLDEANKYGRAIYEEERKLEKDRKEYQKLQDELKKIRTEDTLKGKTANEIRTYMWSFNYQMETLIERMRITERELESLKRRSPY